MPNSLADALTRFAQTLAASDPAVARSLRKAAPAAKLARLAKVTGAVPADVRTWFAWRDGQRGAAIGPSENDRILSIDEALSAWTFLEDEGHAPWKSSWLPLATNGAGDYLVIERASGVLLRYQHDARARPQRARSLRAWIDALEKDWATAAQSAKASEAPEGWTPAKSPKAAALRKKPAGTAYLFRAPSPMLGKGVFVHVFWKQAPNTWFQATQPTLASAWTTIGNNLLPFQATPDAGMEHCLRAERVGEGGLFEKHEPEPPFAKAKAKKR